MDILIQTAVYSYNGILLSKTRNSTKWLNLTGVILNQRNHKNEYINIMCDIWCSKTSKIKKAIKSEQESYILDKQNLTKTYTV